MDHFRRLGMTRYAVFTLLDRVWQLRDNLSAYDASYVALAESLDCTLLTADARLSRAPGLRCPITVVPR
ncbi:MAG: type II toxin-antitoxin system VapC family toxin [Nocardioides sp.]